MTLDLSSRRPLLAAAAVLPCTIALGLLAEAAHSQDLQAEVGEKREQLDSQRGDKEVLTGEISELSGQISQLEGELAVLRTREAAVLNELESTRNRLRSARVRLAALRARYRRSLRVLERRLVAIYKSDEPDALTVILNADGFDDMIERYEYLGRIEDRDSTIIDRVRTLKTDTAQTVEEIETAKAEIAAKKAELARTRAQLEAQEASLSARRREKADTLAAVDQSIERLEGDIEGLEQKIQDQLRAAAREEAATGGLPAEIPAGPIKGGGGAWVWPVDGTVTSPFGPRWGRMHEGIDIAAPGGTQLRAADSGTVAIAGPTGGYGNYTCVNHGGGLTSCYAHQSSIGVSVGESVSQGEVIGSVGCTGSCTGDHVHFEARINGSATDPMGYL